MNKRMTYILATLLIAQSAVPLSAQSISEQGEKHLSITQDYLRTTSGGIIITPPTTTGPAVTVKLDKIYATEIADARAKIDFQLHNVELKEEYTNQASSLHIALESNMALTSITSTGEADKELIDTPGVVIVYDSKNFTFEFTAKNINPDSIVGNSYFTFVIPGYLLTTNVDLNVTVRIEHDRVNPPTISPDSTTSSAIKLVNLSHDSQYSRILYTLDGSNVTLASNHYDGQSIEVKPSETLKAVAYIGTMPSEQIVVGYNDIPSIEDPNSGGTSNPDGDSNSGGGSSSGGTSNPGGGSNSGGTSNPDGGSNSGGTSNPDGGSNSGGTSNPDGSSNFDGDSNSSESSTNISSSTSETEDSDRTVLDVTSIPDTISNTVATLIEQKERNLTTKATEVQYGLTINNQKVKLENKLLVSKGRTLVPLRTIIEALDVPIRYHAASKTAIIKFKDKLIEFPLGYNVAIVNGEMVQIDAKDESVMSIVKNGRTYLPIRFIAEQFNLNFHFDGEQVHINSVK